MAISYVWPGPLPQSPRPGYGETGGTLLLRSPMDAGPAKQRRRGRMPATLSLTLQMTPEQVVLFETFVLTTLRGVTRFGFPHPRLHTQAEVRIVPESGGKLYALAFISAQLYEVSFTLEVLP